MKKQGSSFTPGQSLSAIRALIKEGVSGEHFAQLLRKRKIPHLSFSQVAAVEFCHQRYYLDYVQGIELDPVPHYFIKGKLLHQFIADSYNRLASDQRIDSTAYAKTICQVYQDQQHRRHLENAVQVHLENIWSDHQILGVEQPFVFMIDKKLPPLVGVVDLLLQKDDHVIIVDHKTGNDFYPPDRLQMAIYHKYARQKFPDKQIDIYYDQYRWVNNLARIRKPPLQRTRLYLPDSTWIIAFEQIRAGYRAMEEIRKNDRATRIGECFRCPFRQVCW